MFLPIKSPLVALQHQHPSERAGSVLLGSALPLDPSQLSAWDSSLTVSAGMSCSFAAFEPPYPSRLSATVHEPANPIQFKSCLLPHVPPPHTLLICRNINPHFATIHPEADPRDHLRDISHDVKRKMSGREALSLQRCMPTQMCKTSSHKWCVVVAVCDFSLPFSVYSKLGK